MTDFLALVTNTEEVFQLAATTLGKYDLHTVLAQSQLGRELVVENAKLIVAMDIMSDVMRDNKTENEDLKVTLEVEVSTGPKFPARPGPQNFFFGPARPEINVL